MNECLSVELVASVGVVLAAVIAELWRRLIRAQADRLQELHEWAAEARAQARELHAEILRLQSELAKRTVSQSANHPPP